MADAFLTLLKDFERVVVEIGETTERLQMLEASRDQLRKQLKALAGNTDSSASSSGGSDVGGKSQAVAQVVEAIRALGGSARLADIAKGAGLDTKVTATRLQRAAQSGVIVRSGHGQYQLPAEELSALAGGGNAVSPSSNAIELE